MARMDVATKLAAARTRLVLEKPFLGALVLRLPLQAAQPDWCKTTYSDARKLYYNHFYIDALTLAETQFVLAQEALHCALSHFSRRGHRTPHLWDLACDYAINPILIHDGLTAPPGALYEHSYVGMTAEEIYPFLLDNENESEREENLFTRPDSAESDADQPPPPDTQNPPKDPAGDAKPQEQKSQPESDGHGQDQTEPETPNVDSNGTPDPNIPEPQEPGAAEPPPLSAREQETLAVQWQQRLSGAAQHARQAGKLSRDMARLVEYLLEPKLPWRALLSHYMTARARDDYSYTRPSSRRGEPAIFPSLRSHQLDVVAVLDTSGSITPEEMNDFVAEIDAIKGQIRARIQLHSCDDRLNPDGPWVYEVWEPMHLPERLRGGGGTSFEPVFAWAESLDQAPDLLVYFTDAEGKFPAGPPTYPVLWLVKGKAPVPWGQRIQLN